MKVELVSINTIKPYKNNPRINSKSRDYVANSLKEYGFQQPIVVDNKGVIIVGHTRFLAAKDLGFEQVPVLVADTLTPEQVKAYRIADNKTHEYALWDDQLLSDEFKDLLVNNDINGIAYLTAFSELEIDKLINGDTYAGDELEEQKSSSQEFSDKRVALLVLKNSYVNRGVATYVNGWLEWGLRNQVQVDIISDDYELRNNQFSRYEQVANWISPEHDYTDDELNPPELEEGDTNAFANYADNHNWIAAEQAINDDKVAMRSPIIRLDDSVKLRSSIIEAFSRYHYDAVILNTIDTLFSVISLGLHKEHPNIYYATHAPVDVGLGGNTYLDSLTKSLVESSGVKILCQSDWVRDVFHRHTNVDQSLSKAFIPMLGQPELLEFPQVEDRKGILYIGPYESRKNPEVFIAACKKNRKPALVITPSKKSAQKFKRRFIQEGIEHEIHVALTGKNKVEVIKRASLAIIPSTIETFCFTAFEAAHLCRTIIPANRAWSQAHKDWCILVPEHEIADSVMEHYDKPITEQAKQALLAAKETSDVKAFDLLVAPSYELNSSNALTKWMESHDTTSVEEFFKSRPSIVLDEIFYVMRLAQTTGYLFKHTKEQTIIVKE